MLIFLVMGIAMNWVSYFYSDKIVLKMYNAQQVSPEEAPQLHQIVERVAQEAGIPKPKVYIVQDEVPNAFATGRNPQHGVVAVTTGILNALTWRELEGVLAHEMGHVKNRDTLISTVAATIAGAIGSLAQFGHMGLLFGGGGRNQGEGGGGNPLTFIVGMITVVVAPIIAMMVQMAISRTREYGADATGAHFTGDPGALANALEKIDAYAHREQMPVTPGTQHMFIINPLSGSSMSSLFSTHPPTEERVKRLREMPNQMGMNREVPQY